MTAPVWKAVATRQREGQFVAQERQKLLKKAVIYRSQVISELEKMMKQRLYAQEVRSICEASEEDNNSELDSDDIALFEEYLQDLDTVYSRTDDIFEACCVEDTPGLPYKVGPERRQDGDMECIENLDVLHIPFGFEQTCSTMWKSMVQVHRQEDRHHYAGVIDTENTIAAKSILQYPRQHEEPGRLMVHLALRRYLEAGRMIIVWRALSEGESEFRGMNSDETGWCVVRPINKAAGEDSPFRTVMQTFVRSIPINLASSATGEAEQFANIVLASVEENAGICPHDGFSYP